MNISPEIIIKQENEIKPPRNDKSLYSTKNPATVVEIAAVPPSITYP